MQACLLVSLIISLGHPLNLGFQLRQKFLLVDAATARECTFKTFDSYSFAPDGSKLLIATETTPIYLSLIHI